MYSRPSFIGQYNIRKGFLNKNLLSGNQLNSEFDEPTYLSFKLNFYSEEDYTQYTTYDGLPQSLFALPENNEKWLNWTSDEELRGLIENYTYNTADFVADRTYSAIDYLLDKNEDFRAFLLCKFIKGWYELQEQYQFYFQSVSGLDEFFKSDPIKGQKLSKDVVVTIECLEAIDQRVKYLLSLYKAAAWDDEYQRWILPDIHRYFKMDIFISEIRTFHASNYAENNSSALTLVSNAAASLVDKALGWLNDKINSWTGGGVNNNVEIETTSLQLMNGICPVTCIHCEMCDLDINTNWYQSQYNINNSEAEKTTFKVRVKKSEIIYNWTLIDRVFGHLYSNTERGKKSITASQGWRDYLKVDNGPMTQSVFNNTYLESGADLVHSYSGAITGGWIMETANKAVSSLTDSLQSGGSIFDIAADIYNTVKSAIAGYNTTKDKDTESKATNGGSIELHLQGANPNSTLVKAALTEITKPVVGDSTTVEQAKQVLKNIGTQYKDLSKEQQKSIQEIMGKVGMTIAPTNKDRSVATNLDGGPNQLKEVAMSGVTPKDSDLIPIDQKEISFSAAAAEIQKEKDRSKATDLDGGPGDIKLKLTGVTPKDSDLTPIDAKPLNFSMQSAELQSEKDRSMATDLDGQTVDGMISVPQIKDRSVATDLDGIDSSGLISVPQIKDRSVATDLDGLDASGLTNVPQVKDKSYATDLDGQDASISLTSVPQVEDKSYATDLDGQNVSGLTEMPQNNDRSMATDLDGLDTSSLTSVPQAKDRSLATDLDGLDASGLTNVPQVKDRSYATDLDGQEVNGLTNIPQVTDKSYATDLDGQENIGNLTSVPQVEDRSYATDLDGQSIEGLVEVPQVEDRSYATDLDGLALNGDLIAVPQVEDRSMATDLDGQDANGLTNVPQVKDRSYATDLDGQDNTGTLTNIPQIDDKSYATDLDGQDNIGTLTNVPQVEDRSMATDLDGQDVNGLTNVPQVEDRSYATDLDGQNVERLTNIPQNELNLSTDMTNIPQVEDRSYATDLDGLDYGNLTDIPQNELNLSTDMTAIPQKDISLSEDMTDVPQVEDRSYATDLDGLNHGQLTNLPRNELNLSTDMTNVPQNKLSLETQMTPIQPSSYTIQTDMTSTIFTEHRIESIMDKIVQDIKKNEEITDVRPNSVNDRSKATDLDAAPSFGSTTSIMDSIVKSQATSQNTLSAAEIVKNEPTQQTSNLVVMENGEINPEATIGDILLQYNEYKKTNGEKGLTKSDIVGGNPTKTIQKSSFVGSKPSDKIAPMRYNSAEKRETIEKIAPIGGNTPKDNGRMTSVKKTNSSNKKIKTVL